MRNRKAAEWELYDLGTDPGETEDLAATRPDVRAELLAIYERERARDAW